MDKHLLRSIFCEFIASLIFAFFGPAAATNGGEQINYATAFGFTIAALAFSIGDVSGGHINPAVTLAMAITKQIDISRCVTFMLAQFIGAICGGAILYGAVGHGMFNSGIHLNPDLSTSGGFICEFMGTFFLIFVIFNVALWSTGLAKSDIAGSVVSGMSPLTIGLTITVVHLSIGPLTGCGINPARVVGTVIFEGDEWWKGHTGKRFWIYLVGPFLASLIAPLTYYGMYPGRLHRSYKTTDMVAVGTKDKNQVVPVDAVPPVM